MRKSLRNSLLVGALAALGVSVWLVRSASVSRAAPDLGKSAGPTGAGGRGPIDEQERARQLAAVQKVVQLRNQESRAQAKAFEDAGWEVTRGTAPPDHRLVALDPSLLKGREAELREQMASTTARPEDAKNLAQIAKEAKELETRWTAVEGLYRIAGDGGQKELYELLRDGSLAQGDEARGLIAPRLQPQNLDDSYAADVARLLDNPGLSLVEKTQIATTLALIALRDGSMLNSGVLSTLSPGARALIDARIEWVKTELPKAWAGSHGHEHEGR